MSKKYIRHLTMASFLFSLLATANNVCAQVPCGGYEVTAIIQVAECPPFGFPPTLPDGMNDAGSIVGHYQSCVIGPDIAFKWTTEDGFQILPMPQGTVESRAHDVNNSPKVQIVGEFNLSGDGLGPLGFLLDGEEFIEISYPGGSFCQPKAVNDKRQVAGTTSDRTVFHKAFYWEDGQMTLILPTFGLFSLAHDISEAGVVVGWMGNGLASDARGFIWDDGRITELPAIPGGFISQVNQINARHQLTVSGKFNDDHPLGYISGGFLWENGRWTDLGMLPGYDSMALTGLNDAGIVAGWSRALDSSNLPDAGFIWQNGVMTDLNDLIPQGSGLWIARAEAISNVGQITGFGEDDEGNVVGFVLTPIEKPVGDLDGDCQISIDDLELLLLAWGLCPNCKNCDADLNNDCKVSTYDLLILLSNWG